MKKQILIGIAEDHQIVRDGLIALLKGHPVINVLFGVGNGKELLEKLKGEKPDIILLDLDMPIMSGKETLDKIKHKFPKMKVMIMSATFRNPIIVDYVKKGVNSFLDKNCKIDELVNAIYTVYDQGTYFDARITEMLARELTKPTISKDNPVFSSIEISILKLICKGCTSKSIAEQLFINHRTVESHRSDMMRKVSANNVTSLILYAIKNNLVDIA